MKSSILIVSAILLAFLLCSCWQVAAARAAKKRTGETGHIVGTVEDEAGVDDPLGRKKRSLIHNENNGCE